MTRDRRKPKRREIAPSAPKRRPDGAVARAAKRPEAGRTAPVKPRDDSRRGANARGNGQPARSNGDAGRRAPESRGRDGAARETTARPERAASSERPRKSVRARPVEPDAAPQTPVVDAPEPTSQRAVAEQPSPTRSAEPPPAKEERSEAAIPPPSEGLAAPAAFADKTAAEYDDLQPESYPDIGEEVAELGIGSPLVPPHLRFDSEVMEASSVRPSSGAPAEPSGDLEGQIRALEARLDGLIRRAGLAESDVSPSARRGAGAASGELESLAPPSPAAPPDAVAAKYVARQWSREALRSRFEEIDDFGLDPAFEARVRPALDLLYRRYFRVQTEGLEHVPSAGGAVIVANHSGTLPLDGAMLRAAIRLDHPSGRDLRWLAEDFVFYLPFAGVVLNRIGAVRACPENAERLLEREALVAVFPEGLHGIKKLFRERYRLQRFGRGGYIRLCLRTRAPLVPCAIVGAEEASPLLYRIDWLAEIMKLPYLPITPTFPLFGPLGLMPAPTRWKIRFGEPISFDHYGPEAADDHVLVGTLSDRVRSSIQALIDGGLRARKSIWFG
ncbi:MAG TPA: 1-acyl-sn-glycerol-3-phosphate acyltransferase [Polyangiaceae bacterium]|nr:1-acyl-sn-glycerol-3-phosphate acyltransferase [Polyangiaceae bacterium]